MLTKTKLQNCHVAVQSLVDSRDLERKRVLGSFFQLEHEIKKDGGTVHEDEECTVAVCMR